IASLLAGLSATAGNVVLGQQTATLVITVIDSAARYPLANADVIDLNTGQRRFTDESGTARLAWPSDDQLRLRVRQVGYQPIQRTLRQANTAKGAITFAMRRVTNVISPVRANSYFAAADDSALILLRVSGVNHDT